MSDPTEVRFPASNGRTVGWLGIGLILLAAVATLVDGWHDSDPVVVAFLLTGAAVVWIVVLRPHAVIRGRDLELHHPFHVVRVPLVEITFVEVRMSMLVWLGETKLSFSPISRTRRALLKGGEPDPLNNYQDLVEERILAKAKDFRAAGEPGGRVRRAPEWVPIGLLLALLALSALLALL